MEGLTEHIDAAGRKGMTGERKVVILNDNAIEYMQRLGFRDVVLIVEKFTT